MRQSEAVGKFGEYFITMMLQNFSYETDLVDAAGIDLMAYRKKPDSFERYGISVKTRNAYDQPNNSLLLKWNDVVYTHEQSVLRGAIPAYAIVWNSNNRIDILIITHDYLLKKRGYESIDDFRTQSTKQNTLSVSTSQKSRDEWILMYQNKTPGVIFAAKYVAE